MFLPTLFSALFSLLLLGGYWSQTTSVVLAFVIQDADIIQEQAYYVTLLAGGLDLLPIQACTLVALFIRNKSARLTIIIDSVYCSSTELSLLITCSVLIQ